MALNFPDSPTNGQKYTDATTGETWTYELATNSWTSDGLTTAVGIQYKGGINITTAPPAGVAGGWQYTVTTGGTANAGFTGLTGNVPTGTTVIYDGANWQTAGAGVLWVRTGTELTPSSAGDSVFTSGEVKVGGTTAAPNLQIKADGGIVANTNGLVYDAANKRLGVGSSAPGDVIHAKGSSTYAGIIADNSASTGGGAFRAYRNGVQKAIFCVDSWVSNTGSDDAAIVADTGGGIKFYTNNSLLVPKAYLTSGGSLGIGNNAPDSTLTIKAATGVTPFKVSGPSSEFAKIDTSGRLLVGTSSSSLSNKFLLQGDTSSGTNGGYMRLQTANSIVSGTSLGSIGFGDDANNGALIEAKGDVSWSPFGKGSRLEFSVTADGASSPTEAMRIKNSKIINIANTPVYADNAAAKTGGLVDGDVYRTSTGDLKIVYT